MEISLYLFVNLVFVFKVVFGINHTYITQMYMEQDKKKLILFKDEKSILEYFEKERENEPEKVRVLLQGYNNCFCAEDVPVMSEKRRPFIVIEGNNRLTRDRIAKKLAWELGAKYIHIPPNCLLRLANLFRRLTFMRRVFYQLCLYAAAFEVRQMLALGKTVVMNGYWYEQAAYIIGRMYNYNAVLLPQTSPLYSQPKDLMKPDLLFYLNDKHLKVNNFVTNNTRRTFVPIFSRVYKFFREIPVKILFTEQNTAAFVEKLKNITKKVLDSKFDLRPPLHSPVPVNDSFLRSKYYMFENKKQILALFEELKAKQRNKVDRVLTSFFKCFVDDDNKPVVAGKRKPFIVIEGNHRPSRITISRLLARRLNARFYSKIPKIMFSSLKLFTPKSIARRAIYALGLYGVAHLVKQCLALGKPAVVNGYWYETAAFLYRKILKINSIEPLGPLLRTIPTDLLKPDVLIYLHHVDINRSNPNLYSDFQSYRQFTELPVTIIEMGYNNTHETVDKVYKYILETLYDKDKYDFGPSYTLDKLPSNLNSQFVLFKDEKSVLSYFESLKASDSDNVCSMLRTYYDCYFTTNMTTPFVRKQPFIVVEGNERGNRHTIIRKLLTKMNAKGVSLPPKCLSKWRFYYKEGGLTSSAFMQLSMYPAAYAAKHSLSLGKPVIMSGYWYQQAAYVMRKLYLILGSLPPVKSEMYKLPSDLLEPDLLLFIDYKRKTYAKKPTKMIIPISRRIYTTFDTRMKTPSAIIESTSNTTATFERILEIMRTTLGDKYDLKI